MRLLQVYNKNHHEELEIFDSEDSTLLYHVSRDLEGKSKHKFELSRCLRNADGTYNKEIVARFAVYRFDAVIKVDCFEEEITMTNVSTTSTKYDISSLKFHATWMKDGVFCSDIKLVDRSGQVLAKYEVASFSRSKHGRIHIVDHLDDAIVDLIVITGVAKMEKQRMDNNQSGRPDQSMGMLGNGMGGL